MEQTVEELDRVRVQLEENVKKLQGLVKHWRIWEAEYEGLKEGIEQLKDGAFEKEIQEAAYDCEGDLLTQKEIKSLIEDKSTVRKPKQIISLVDRRIDYVQQNVKTMEKRLDAEQQKLDEANFIGHMDEEGLPLMEITEELDEDDNVISSAVIKPREAAPQLLDLLRKGGIKDAETDHVVPTKTTEDLTSSQTTLKSVTGLEDSAAGGAEKLPKKRKSVTFAESPVIHEHKGQDAEPESTRKVRFAEAVEVNKAEPLVNPIIPENEPEDESALRRQMLEYSMRNIGTIVAELDMTDGEDNEDEEDEEEEEDEDEDNYDDEDELEDEFGRTTVQVINDKYRQQMLDLEKKLNARAIINVGPEAGGKETKKVPVNQSMKVESSANKENKSKAEQSKGVRFAEELEIQESSEPRPPSTKETKSEPSGPNPLKDEIVEREPEEIPSNVRPKQKLSKFKAARMNGAMPDDSQRKVSRYGTDDNLYPTDATEIPKTQAADNSSNTMSTTIVEKPSTDSTNIREPDSLDPELHTAEIRNAYHQMRNTMIQREDGFMNQDMEEYEDEHGKQQVSRFKAARLAKQKMEQGN